MNQVLIFAFLFFIGSCLGWCMEVFFRRFFSRANPERKWINPGFLARAVSAPLRLRSVGHVCRVRAECCGYDAQQGTGCSDHSGDHGGGHDHHRIHRRNHFYPRYACETLGLYEGKRQYQRYHLPQVFSHMGPAWMRVLFLCQPICGGLGSTGFHSIWHFPFSSACFSECSPSTSGILSTSPVRCGTSHRKRISWSNTRS